MLKPKIPRREEGKIKAEIDTDTEIATLRTESEALDLQSKTLMQQAQTKRVQIATLANQHNQDNDVLKITDEIWFKIFSYVPSRSRASIQRTCIRFFKLASDPRLPLFPLNYAAPPKIIEANNNIPAIKLSEDHPLQFFNLPSPKQCIVLENLQERKNLNGASGAFLLRIINSYTGQIESESTLSFTYYYKVRFITLVEENKLMLIADRTNFADFFLYDILTHKYKLAYQFKTHHTKNCRYLQISARQFALLYLYDNKQYSLRLLTLKESILEQDIFIDLGILKEGKYLELDKIEHGNFKDHLVIHNGRMLLILDLKGKIKLETTFTPPETFEKYQKIHRMISDNELIMAWKFGLLHVNLLTQKLTFIDINHDMLPFDAIDVGITYIYKIIDNEHILLIYENGTVILEAIVWNWRTRSLVKMFNFVDTEQLPVESIHILNNRNWAITTLENNCPNKVILFSFPEQQHISQHSLNQAQALNSDDTKIMLGKRGSG